MADSSVEQVVWEVGSVSDSDDDAEKPRGVGGVAKDGYGERGGLLFDREEEDEEGAVPRTEAPPVANDRIEGYRAVDPPSPSGSRKRSGEEEEDPFGDFEDVKR